MIVRNPDAVSEVTEAKRKHLAQSKIVFD